MKKYYIIILIAFSHIAVFSQNYNDIIYDISYFKPELVKKQKVKQIIINYSYFEGDSTTKYYYFDEPLCLRTFNENGFLTKYFLKRNITVNDNMIYYDLFYKSDVLNKYVISEIEMLDTFITTFYLNRHGNVLYSISDNDTVRRYYYNIDGQVKRIDYDTDTTVYNRDSIGNLINTEFYILNELTRNNNAEKAATPTSITNGLYVIVFYNNEFSICKYKESSLYFPEYIEIIYKEPLSINGGNIYIEKYFFTYLYY